MKFSKKDRLLSRSDFSAVFDAAHSSAGREKAIFHIDPYIIYRKKTEGRRLGLSVARRVIRKSHERNRIKRCLREFFRLHKGKISGDLIIRVVSRPLTLDYDILTQPIAKFLLKSTKTKVVA